MIKGTQVEAESPICLPQLVFCDVRGAQQKCADIFTRTTLLLGDIVNEKVVDCANNSIDNQKWHIRFVYHNEGGWPKSIQVKTGKPLMWSQFPPSNYRRCLDALRTHGWSWYRFWWCLSCNGIYSGSTSRKDWNREKLSVRECHFRFVRGVHTTERIHTRCSYRCLQLLLTQCLIHLTFKLLTKVARSLHQQNERCEKFKSEQQFAMFPFRVDPIRCYRHVSIEYTWITNFRR